MNKTFTALHDQALTMGEHIEQMREAYEALERERDALAAYVKRLEFHTSNLCVMCSRYDEPCNRTVKGFTTTACSDYIKVEAVSFEAPSQSLNHIKAQIAERQCSELAARVEEETVEHFCNYVAHELGLDLTREDVANYERKYAKQAGSTVEEGE